MRSSLLMILLSVTPCDGPGDKHADDYWAPDAGPRDAGPPDSGTHEGTPQEGGSIDTRPPRDWLAWVEAPPDGGPEILRATMIRDGGEPATFEVARSGESEVLDFAFVPAANALTYLSHRPSGLGAVSVVKLSSDGIGEAIALNEGATLQLGETSARTVFDSKIALIGAASEPPRSWIDIYDLNDVTAAPIHIEPGETVSLRGPISGFSPSGQSFIFGIDRVRYATFFPLEINDLHQGRRVLEQAAWVPNSEDLVFTDGVSTFVQNPFSLRQEATVLVDGAPGPFAVSKDRSIAVVVGSTPPSLAMFSATDLTTRTTISAPFAGIQAIKWIEWHGSRLFMQAVHADGVHAWLVAVEYNNSFVDAVDLGVIAGVSNERASRSLVQGRDELGRWAVYLDGAANSGLHLLNSATATQLRISAITDKVSRAWMAASGAWVLFIATGEAQGSLPNLFAVKLESDKLSVPVKVELGSDLSVEDVVLSANGDFACVLTNQASYVFDLRSGFLRPGVQLEGRAYKAAWGFPRVARFP